MAARKATAPTRRTGNHVYYVDGEKWQGRGVTTLLGGGMPKGALVQWAAKQVAACAVDERETWEPLAEKSREAAFDYLSKAQFRDVDQAAKKGTAVHSFAEQLATGQEVDVPDELLGHVDSYLEFRETWQPADEVIERMVINRTQRYAGTFDAIATVQGWGPKGEPARLLYDIKTSRSGVFPEVALQLAAYRYAETMLPLDGSADEEPVPEVDGCAVLHLRTDGFSFVPVDAGPRALRQFLYCAQTSEFVGVWDAEARSRTGWGDSLVGHARTPNDPF